MFEGNLPCKTHRPKYLMNDPSPTKKTPFRLIKSAKVFVSSLHCSVLKPCDQKQRLLVVLEFGFEGLSNKPAFAGRLGAELHGETWWNKKNSGISKGTYPPSTPCWVAMFSKISRSLHSHRCISLRPHSTRDPNYPWWFASDGFLWPGRVCVQTASVFGTILYWGYTKGRGFTSCIFVGDFEDPRLSLHFFIASLGVKSIPKALRVWRFWYLWPPCVWSVVQQSRPSTFWVCQMFVQLLAWYLVKVGWGWNSRDHS